MKVSTIFFISILGIFSPAAHASDILSCHVNDDLSSRSLRVFSSTSESGYNFELYLSHRFAHELPGPYATGVVTRHGMVFENDDIKFVHLFGEYAYMDLRDGTDLRFPDSGCAIAGDSSAATVSLEDLPTNETSLNPRSNLSTLRSCTPAQEQMGCHTEGGYNGLPYCECSGIGGNELGATTHDEPSFPSSCRFND